MEWKTLTLGSSWLRWSKHNDDDNDDDDDVSVVDDEDDDDDDDDDAGESPVANHPGRAEARISVPLQVIRGENFPNILQFFLRQYLNGRYYVNFIMYYFGIFLWYLTMKYLYHDNITIYPILMYFTMIYGRSIADDNDSIFIMICQILMRFLSDGETPKKRTLVKLLQTRSFLVQMVNIFFLSFMMMLVNDKYKLQG